MLLFVYGTLLSGMDYAHLLSDATFLGLAYTFGSLYEVSWYPALVEGEGMVFGELYDVKENTLKVLDEFEDYDACSPDKSVFVRRLAPVRVLGFPSEREAFCYFYNRKVAGNRIECGDYRRHVIDKYFEKVPVVVPEGAHFVAGAEFAGRCFILKGFLRASNNACFEPNSSYDPLEAKLYLFDRRRISLMDRFAKGCVRIGIAVSKTLSDLRIAESYIKI